MASSVPADLKGIELPTFLPSPGLLRYLDLLTALSVLAPMVAGPRDSFKET